MPMITRLTDAECLDLYRRVWSPWGPALDAETVCKVRVWLGAATLADAVRMPDWVTSVCRECGNAHGTTHEKMVRRLREMAGVSPPDDLDGSLRAKLAEEEKERNRLRSDANARFEKAKGDNLTIRKACRMREPLGGADAECLEHAITMTEEERDAALATVARLKDVLKRVLEAKGDGESTDDHGAALRVRDYLPADLRAAAEEASK